MAVVGIVIHRALRGRPDAQKERALAALAGGNVVLYTWYTFNSILDPAVPVNLAQNLPFHLCNLVAWGLIPAALFDIKRLRAFCFFPGALAGLLTLTSPVDVYVGHPLLSLPTIGFYGVHSMNVILGTLLATLGLYRPSYRDALVSVLHLCILAVVIFPLDLVMRALVDPNTNYFYLFAPENAEILVAVHNAVPVPLLYIFILSPIALVGCLIQAAIYDGAHRLSSRRITITEPA
jgi:uncharacterized membrane protein YwaF